MLNYGECYLDLGTANTLIYTKSQGILANEPTLLTSDNNLNYSAFGKISQQSLGKTSGRVHLIKPLKEGVISDFKATLKYVEYLMKNVDMVFPFQKSRLLISLPYQVSQHEKQVIKDLGNSLGARTVDLVSEPMVAAIGSGLNVLESEGKMVVDLGGGTSEAAVISLGGIVCANAVRVGGISLDESITSHLKHHYLFSIGELTSEKLKIEVGSLSTNTKERELLVGGTNLKTGLPSKLKVDSSMIKKPLENYYAEISKMISSTLEMCPPELASDLIQNGILLVGGSALIHGLKERVEKDTGVKTILSSDPLLSVAHGGSKVLNDHSLFEGIEKTNLN